MFKHKLPCLMLITCFFIMSLSVLYAAPIMKFRTEGSVR